MKSIFVLSKSALKATLAIMFAAMTLNASAQNENRSITGTVTDKNKQPMPGANVLLLNYPDSSYVYGTATASNGSFSLKARLGKYMLSVSMTGFQKQFLFVDISANTPAFIKPVILEEKTQAIGEVTIVGTKNVIEFEAGKTIVNPGASILSSQGNTLDILKNIPGLIAMDDGSIILNGQKGVNVQINGKETYLSGIALANLLKATAASSVEKIEIITSPSAEYDASGKAGVINIRLKKTPLQGRMFSSNINYQQGKDARGDIWARATLRKKKIGFSADFFHFRGDKAKKGIVFREYLPMQGNFGSTVRTAGQDVSLTNRDNTHNFKLMADYDVSKSITLDANLRGSFFQRSIPGNSYTLFSKTNSLSDSALNTKSYSSYRQTTLNGGIRANYKDENKCEANISVDYLSFAHHENPQIFSSLVNSLGSPIRTDSLLGDLDGNINMLSSQSNVSIPLSGKIQFQAGGKATWINIDNRAIYNNPSKIGVAINYKYSCQYTYKENNNAAYLQLSAKFDHWGFQAGLRAENTHIEGTNFDIKDIERDSSYQVHYTNFFPNVAILYTLNDKHGLSFTYNRRITRPNYRDLSPFDYMVDEYTVSKGNPKLKAELTHNLEMAYILGKTYRASVFYTFTNDAIAQGFKELKNGGLLITPINLASNKRLGIKLDAGRLIDIKWWQMSASISVFYAENNWLELSRNKTSTQITPLANCNNQFVFAKGWSAQLTGYYNGKMSFGQMGVPAGWSVSGGVRKKMLNDNLIVHLYFNDIFASIREKASFESGSIKGFSNVRYDETSVGVSVYYNLQKGKQKEKESPDRNIEEGKRINF
jgi:vitamin B12 transporter